MRVILTAGNKKLFNEIINEYEGDTYNINDFANKVVNKLIEKYGDGAKLDYQSERCGLSTIAEIKNKVRMFFLTYTELNSQLSNEK